MKTGLLIVLIAMLPVLPSFAGANADAMQERMKRAQLLERTDSMGFRHFVQGNMDEAMECFQEACRIASELKDTAQWSLALSSIGAIYGKKEAPDSSLTYYREALRLMKHTHDYAEQANLLSNIALQHMQAGQLDEAVQIGEKAVETARQSGEMEAIMYAGHASSTIYFRRGEYPQGIRALHHLIEEATRQNVPSYRLRGYRILLQMFDRRGLRDSVSHYMQAIDTVITLLPPDSRDVALALEQQAIIYSKYKQYRKSLNIQQKLLRHEGRGRLSKDKIYLAMARNYCSLYDYLRAVKYFDFSIKASDSIQVARLNEQKKECDSRIQFKNQELAEAHAQQQALEQEIHSLRQTLVFILTLSFLLLLGCLWHLFKEKLKRIKDR